MSLSCLLKRMRRKKKSDKPLYFLASDFHYVKVFSMYLYLWYEKGTLHGPVFLVSEFHCVLRYFGSILSVCPYVSESSFSRDSKVSLCLKVFSEVCILSVSIIMCQSLFLDTHKRGQYKYLYFFSILFILLYYVLRYFWSILSVP